MRRRITALFAGIAVLTTTLAAGQQAAMASTSRTAAPAIWYTVQVRTGTLQGASTQAGVFLYIKGANQDFGWVQMKNSSANFTYNKLDTFKFLTPDLGRIKEICVWRNDVGPNPKWYLDWIMVWKGNTGTGGTGTFYQWIPKEEWVCKVAT